MKNEAPETVQAIRAKAAPYNPRTITPAQEKMLAAAMTEFGDLGGLVVNVKTGRVVGGHQRLKQLDPSWPVVKKSYTDKTGTVALGYVETPRGRWAYREVDWPEAKEKAANIAANKHGGAFDIPKLKDILVEIQAAEIPLELTGFDADDLAEMLAEEGAAIPENVDDLPPPMAQSKTKRGDVWICGDHRVMCGDSTSAADISRLMGDDRAALYFSDPPYGVSYEGGGFDVIKGDHKRDDDLYNLVTGALKQAVAHTTPGAAFYIWHASSTRREFEDAMRDAGLIEKQYLIWVKNSIVLGHADYHWTHEPCFYAGKEGQKVAFHGDRTQSTVWRATLKKRDGLATTLGQALLLTDGKGGQIALTPRMPKGKKTRTARLVEGQTMRIEIPSNSVDVLEVGRDLDGYKHPTQKPVALSMVAIANSTKPGEIVLDTFSGSGSTLLGCEATGRRGRVMDLDPTYAWVAVERWQDLTGRKAFVEKGA
ncbi:MAG: DNA modification methylase [Sphingomonadales bacterium]|nr:DNA modification methylase [Sphingomonadaceae bacterium]MBS3930388.1 DNA modification methylase [Sphingomonadales bacterium]